MSRFIAVIIFIFVLIGCSSIPSELRESGAIVVAECNSDTSKIGGDYGVVYLSIENSAMAHDWYFKLNSQPNKEYIVDLPISKISIPRLSDGGGFRSKARVACYQLTAGEYEISHLIGKLTGNAGRSSLREYTFSQKIIVTKGSALYLGRYVVYDAETRGKGYFRTAGTSFKKMFSLKSLLPNEIIVDNIDKYSEDNVWLRENHKSLNDWNEVLAIRKIDKLPSAQTYNKTNKH